VSSKSLAFPRHAQQPTVADLPQPDTKRWVAGRKAALVAAVRNGIIDLPEACRRYQISEEEFRAWERAIAAHGVASLQISRLQIYRHAPIREKPR
jgi:hypothetical protein